MALSAERNTKKLDTPVAEYHDVPAVAGEVFIRGGIVVWDESAGGAVVAIAGGAAADYAIGRCDETKTTVSGDKIRVMSGTFEYATTGAVATDVGKTFGITDDETVASTVGTSPRAGIVRQVNSATSVYVTMSPTINAPRLATAGA
jgi:hypothetical protein